MTRRGSRGWLRGIVAITLGALSTGADGHKVSTAYLNLDGDADDPQVFHGRFAISLLDLDFVLGLDADGNGKITWGELRHRNDAIAKYAFDSLTIRGDGLPCTLEPGAPSVTDYTDGSYDLLAFDVVCESSVPIVLGVEYRLFHDVDPSHRGIITLRDGNESASAVSAPSDPAIDSAGMRFELPAAPLWRRLAASATAGLLNVFDPVASALIITFLVAGVRTKTTADASMSRTLLAPSLFACAVLAMLALADRLPALTAPSWRALPIACTAVAAVTLLTSLSERARRLLAGALGLALGAWLAQPLRALALSMPARATWLLGYFVGYACAAFAVGAIVHVLAARLTARKRRGD